MSTTIQDVPCGIIYRVTHRESGQIYIGQTTALLRQRWAGHKCDAKKKPKTFFTRALAKYGAEAFEVTEIDRADSEEELNYLEKYWIKYYKTTDRRFGYNLSEGGRNFFKWSPETLKKISESKKGQHSSVDTEFKKGMIPHNKGKKTSEESRKRVSDSLKLAYTEGRAVAHMKGKSHSPERKLKHSQHMKHLYATGALINPAKGVKRSEKVKKHASEIRLGKPCLARRRAIVCVETGEIFDGMVTAVQHFSDILHIPKGTAQWSLHQAINRRKANGDEYLAFGFHWKRI